MQFKSSFIKTKFLVIGVFFVLCGISCKDSDDSLPQDPLEGAWQLKNVSGGIQGINLEYDKGDVIWHFAMDKSTLEVESTILTTGPKSVYQGFTSGTYPVGFEEQDTTRTIVIDGITFRVLEIDQMKTLVLDDGVVADGFIRSFTR